MPRKSSKKKSRTSYKKYPKNICKKMLSKKIKKNITEMNNKKLKSSSGKFVNDRKMAIAISYSQLKRKYPKCKF